MCLSCQLEKHNHRSKQEHKTQDFIPRFGHTTKVSYFPLRSPQRARTFPTLILHNPTTKVKGNLFSNLLTRAGDTNFLGSSTTLKTPKQSQSVEDSKVLRTTSSHKRCLQQAQETRKRWERKPNLKVTSTNLTPKGLLQSIDLRARSGE